MRALLTFDETLNGNNQLATGQLLVVEETGEPNVVDEEPDVGQFPDASGGLLRDTEPAAILEPYNLGSRGALCTAHNGDITLDGTVLVGQERVLGKVGREGCKRKVDISYSQPCQPEHLYIVNT